MKIIFKLLMLVFFFQEVVAQNISGVINIYQPITAITTGLNSVIVNSSAGFAPGDKVLIIQMQGASIDVTQTNAFGTITAYNNAGNYEFAFVDRVLNTSIIVLDRPVCRTYTVGQGLQLVRVPVYNNPVTIVGALTCLPWNGTVGGILAFEANNTLTFNADINVSGLGFRGGAAVRGGFNCNRTHFGANTTLSNSGTKGEGIAGYTNTFELGRGVNANGGGGAMPGNSGGGGGSNASLAGIGGNEVLPHCSGSTNNGLGGLALDYAADRWYMGGGGGGGFADNGYPVSDGANGGAIVYLKANRIVGNNRAIISNGASVGMVTNDEGAGGGGGAGLLVLEYVAITSGFNVSLVGGDGGNTFNNVFTDACHGVGGGGSGGAFISMNAILSPLITRNLAGGRAGIVSNPASTCFNGSNGGTNGTQGRLLFRTVPTSPVVNAVANPSFICEGGTSTLTALGTGAYIWSPSATLNAQFGPTVIASPTETTTYTVWDGCVKGEVVVYVNRRPTLDIAASNTVSCAGVPVNLCASTSNTELQAGDIAIIRSASDFPDEFNFVTLVPLRAGTQINFTDRGWNASINAFLIGTGEGLVTYTAASDIPAGTVIAMSGLPMQPNDQILAYQGTVTNPRFLYGFSSNRWITSGPVNAASSYLPTNLVNGLTAIDFATASDNGRYNLASNTGNKLFLLQRISNPANWQRSTTNRLPYTWTFNVTAPVVGYVWSSTSTFSNTGVCSGPNTSGIQTTQPGTYTVNYTDIHGCLTTREQRIFDCCELKKVAYSTLIGGAGNDGASAIEFSTNNALITAGQSFDLATMTTTGSTVVKNFGTGNVGFYVARINEQGNTVEWLTLLGVEALGLMATDVKVDPFDQSIYVTASHKQPGYIYNQATLMKFAANGDFLWSVLVPPATIAENSVSVDVTSDDVYVASDKGYARLSKTNGSIVWSATFPNNAYWLNHGAITHDASGNIYLGLLTLSDFSARLVKISPSGSVLASNSFRRFSGFNPFHITYEDNQLYFAGSFNPNSSINSTLLIATVDPNTLTIVDETSLGGYSGAHKVAKRPGGNLFVSCLTLNNNYYNGNLLRAKTAGSDFAPYVLELNPLTLQPIWATYWDDNVSIADMALDMNGGIYFAGDYSGSNNNFTFTSSALKSVSVPGQYDNYIVKLVCDDGSVVRLADDTGKNANDSVVFEELQQDLNLYPNPFEGSIHVRYMSNALQEEETYTLLLYTLEGSVIERHESLMYGHDYELGASLKSGTYLIKVVNDQGEHKVQKIVKY